jgi:multidrug efflux pump subunit AcrA (membrane-fusion protein)
VATGCGSAESAVSPTAAPASPRDAAASGKGTPGASPASSAAVPAADSGGEAVVRAGAIEDIFLLTGELSAVKSLDLVTPRSESWRLQIKWLVEDGTDAKEGDPIVEFDNTSVAQTIEEKRLTRIQSEIDLESRQASLSADGDEKRFAVERARLAAEKAKADAAVPQDLMSRREWQEKQAALREADASLEKARMDLLAFETSSKADIENLKIARDKSAREIDAAQLTLEALSMKAPKPGIVVISENWNEDRKYQVGDNLWPG